AGAQGPAGAAGSGDLGAGVVLLARSAEGCPEGWTPGGSVVLATSPDYPAGPDQQRSNIGFMTSVTAGLANVNFFLCVRSPAP
ncbi:MAG: hypothetical protein ACK4KW_13505, partial [Gemmobacter sp.]